MKKRLLTTLFVAAIASAGLSSAALANNEITFTGSYGNLIGTGNGPILGVLSLQEQGNNTYEWGSSGWSGTTETWSNSTSQVHTDTTPSGYFAQSVGNLTAAGIDVNHLALVFQVNVAKGGTDLSVAHFFVDFINANGTIAGTLEYTPDGHSVANSDFTAAGGASTDNGIFPGVGQGSSGWLFTFNNGTIPANFFSNANNRIGMHVTGTDINAGSSDITGANDGSDNFFFTSTTAPPLVPVPAAAWTGMTALAGLGVIGKIRRKLRRD